MLDGKETCIIVSVGGVADAEAATGAVMAADATARSREAAEARGTSWWKRFESALRRAAGECQVSVCQCEEVHFSVYM